VSIETPPWRTVSKVSLRMSRCVRLVFSSEAVGPTKVCTCDNVVLFHGTAPGAYEPPGGPLLQSMCASVVTGDVI
jgi:hypothetical protein